MTVINNSELTPAGHRLKVYILEHAFFEDLSHYGVVAAWMTTHPIVLNEIVCNLEAQEKSFEAALPIIDFLMYRESIGKDVQ